jgi:hypothetical protein
MLTGDGMPEDSSPYYAVTWPDAEESFTALVSDAGTGKLSMEVFSFSGQERRVTARLWQLRSGEFRVSYDSPQHGTIVSEFTVNQAGQRFSLIVPAQQLLRIRFQFLNPAGK